MRAIGCALLLVPAGVSAAATYDDPWAAATEAAAEAAVARLGAKPALSLVETIRTVPGLTIGTHANTRALAANVQDVKRALKDLGGTESAIEIRIELPGDVLFDIDRAQIRPDAAKALGQVATLIRAYTGSVRLLGHTDSDGSDAHNLALSQRRAEAVEDWLVQREALDAARFSTEGRGESTPRAPNDNATNKQLNRRVEVVVSKQ